MKLLFLLLLLCAASATAADTYRIVHTYPHDPNAFTQGLVFVDGHLYESTGLEGHSSLRMEDLETGRILQFQDVPKHFAEGLTNWENTLIQLTWQDHVALVYDRFTFRLLRTLPSTGEGWGLTRDAQYFGEGLTDWGSTLIQLTWQAHIAFVYDRFSFRLLRTLPYSGEGWGLTHDAAHIILSDGSATLRFLDPQTFKQVRALVVKENGSPVKNLNELEFIHGQIYANIWYTDRIVRISPSTGKVLGSIDLASLWPQNERTDSGAVLNGIAWDAAHDRLFVTGKLWPKLFEIKIVPEVGKSIPASQPRQ